MVPSYDRSAFRPGYLSWAGRPTDLFERNSMASTSRMTGEPVLISMSVLAALQAFFAGSAGIAILTNSDTLAGIMAVGALAVAAAQVGIQFYVRGEVTANSNVVERVEGGKVIAGPANEVIDPGLVIRDLGGQLPDKSRLDRMDGL